MAVYKWKTGARAPVKAQVAGEVCESLAAKGRLTPSELVSASRPKNAPLHGCFEWDNRKAAEAYRETQASYIIRSVEVVREDVSEPVRAFVSLISNEGREYHSVEAALRSADSREAVLEAAKRELASFTRKYEGFVELAEVIEAAERLLEVA